MYTIERLQEEPTQEDKGPYTETNRSSQDDDDKPKSPQLEPVIKDQRETKVTEGHVNTRFFIISDIHTEVFKPDEVPEGAAAAADVMICCGDLTDNSELHEYRRIVGMLSKVAAPLKLVVAGNHDGTLDIEGFWDASNWRYKRWPQRKSDKAAKLFGNIGEARLILEQEGFIVLGEGHHKFPLGNGAELRVYASPATPNRASRYRAFQYKKNRGHGFRIDQDVDVVITHGPPKGILDPDPLGTKYRGCDELFDAIARARPRLHCFGHNHGGWGATLVKWNYETGGEELKTKDSAMHHETELMSLKDMQPVMCGTDTWSKEIGDRRKRELAKARCVPTSHCTSDRFFVRKDKHTLFVNASWSKVIRNDQGQYTQWPWLVDIEIPKQREKVVFANVDGENGTDEITSEGPSAEDYHLMTEKLARLGQGIKDDEADDADEDSSLQETAGEHSNQKTLVQSGIEQSQERRTRRGKIEIRLGRGDKIPVRKKALVTAGVTFLKSWSLSSPDSADRDGDNQDGDQGLAIKNYKEISGVDESLDCDRSVCFFDKASQHRDMNIWGWGQK
ncbi:hypothetical protein VSDG_06959 [Cytospora chrysosperma]|uniref:Calcineurin-like phosphoesterase domain-containing protein n=1 Tax=Cytospora chrysosperma TaxID=252740 RepID=A0A423VRX5_CYTCH|nr:hypothetical protein VSDG_06959 [Valsa sordida]